MRVWIMTSGEVDEGGKVLGVYASPEAASGDFDAAAAELGATATVQERDDGSLWLQVGCDWLDLAPHTVLGQPAVTA